MTLLFALFSHIFLKRREIGMFYGLVGDYHPDFDMIFHFVRELCNCFVEIILLLPGRLCYRKDNKIHP